MASHSFVRALKKLVQVHFLKSGPPTFRAEYYASHFTAEQQEPSSDQSQSRKLILTPAEVQRAADDIVFLAEKLDIALDNPDLPNIQKHLRRTLSKSTSRQRSPRVVRSKHRNIEEEITLLNQQVNRLYQQGRYEQAVAPAIRACELTHRYRGQHHPDFATNLHNLAGVYQAMGNYSQAEPLYLQALEILRATMGETHPDFTLALSSLAQLYRKTGDYARAEPLYVQVLEVRRARLGEAHPDFARSLHNLAIHYYENADYIKAEPLYVKALEIQRTALGEEHPDTIQLMGNLARLYRSTSKYEQAELLYTQALEVRRTALGEAHPDFAASLNSLAALYYLMGKYEQAESFYTQALEVRRTALGEVHPDFATTLNSLGQLYRTMGRYKRAEELLWRALETRRTAMGDAHSSVAGSLNSLGVLYREMGDYEQAELLYMQALQIQRTMLGEMHPDYATSLSNLAQLYRAMGKSTQAEPLLQQGLEIRRTKLGEEHPDVARSLHSLAMLYYSMGRYVQAESLLQQGLKLQRKALGEEHPDVAQSLCDLATLHHTMGNYNQAESLYQQVLEVRRAKLGGEHPDVAQSLGDLAALYQAMGNFDRAESLYRQALDIQRAALGERHPEVATTMNNLASLHATLSNYRQAKSLYQEALRIRRTTLGEVHPDVATSLNTLAVLHFEMGNYRQAESLYQEALRIRRTTLGEAHPDVATSLNNLVILYESQGNYPQAESLLRQSLEIRRTALGDGHPLVAIGLHNLGQLYRVRGNYHQARLFLQQALELQQTTFKKAHPDVAISLNSLAELYLLMGDYAQAEPLFQQSLELQKMTLGEAHPNTAHVLTRLAILYVATDRKTEALALMRQASVIDDGMIEQVFSITSDSQRMEYLSTLRWRSDVFLSLVLQHLSLVPEAIQMALDLVLKRKSIGIEALSVQRDAILSGRYPALAPLLRELALLRMQIGQKVLTGAGPESLEVHQRLLSEWNSRKEQLEMELAHEIPEINIMQRLQSADWRALARVLPQNTALVEFVRFDVLDFFAVPARGEISWKTAHYIVFVLTANDPKRLQLIDLGDADSVDRRVATFRMSITGDPEANARQEPSPRLIRHDPALLLEGLEDATVRHVGPSSIQLNEDAFLHEGRALRAAIFDPLTPALAKYTHLFLAPDGDLTRLPFEVLPTADGRHLLDEYLISYLSTGRDLLRFGTALAGQPAPPLVVADPDFDLGSRPMSAPLKVIATRGRHSRDLDGKTLHFAPLPGTKLEGEQIASLLGGQSLLRERALEGHLKEYGSPRILHIATHGFFLADQRRHANAMHGGEIQGAWDSSIGNRLERLVSQHLENPLLRSGLALAGVNTWSRGGFLPVEAEDGLLTAEDVSVLDLLATELVVLSACETGLGEVRVGEGVFGLRRAFVLAGAKRLVMSLWKVPDQQTQELMVNFYRRILQGHSCIDALREAQLAMKAKHPHPYYWGAFICQGDPGLLSTRLPEAKH